MFRYFVDLIKDWTHLIWSTFGAIIYLAALIIAAISPSPWVYHPLLFVCLVFPSIHFFKSAITGRSDNTDKWSQFTNQLGTTLNILVGIIFCKYLCRIFIRQNELKIASPSCTQPKQRIDVSHPS